MHWPLFLLVLLVLLSSSWSRRGGGGGMGASRGGSASRGSSMGRASSSMGGGARLAPGANRGNTGFNAGPAAGFGGSSRGSMSSYSRGTGVGSMLRSNQFKSAIAGAAAGYLTYRAGKALIRGAGMGMMWNHRPYYWGSNYYQSRPGMSMCRMPIDPDDGQLGQVFFEDGVTRPHEIVWGCSMYEYCCGYECCPSSGSGTPVGFGFGAFIVVLLLLCCCGLIVFKFFRKSLDCIFPSSRNTTRVKYAAPGDAGQPMYCPPAYPGQNAYYPPPQNAYYPS